MEKVMEDGPWLIRYKPLLLNIWTPNTDLKKDVIKSAPLWVKLHHVPIVAYLEIGLSLITTQLGRPLMLDSYTSNMCLSSWGRNTYARALVEFSADEELKESIVIAIPLCNGKGHTLVSRKRMMDLPCKDNAKEANNDNNITIKNSFGVLTEDEEMERNVNNIINDDSECEEVDEDMVFDDRNGEKFLAKGASTPVTNVSND
ncbi:zinc knuckle CX2CX4HX4C containing protein [Tanacetum coccineum]